MYIHILYVCIHIHRYIFTYIHICTYSYANNNIYIYTRSYIYIYVSVYIHIYIYILRYIHIYLYMYTYMNIHTHTYQFHICSDTHWFVSQFGRHSRAATCVHMYIHLASFARPRSVGIFSFDDVTAIVECSWQGCAVMTFWEGAAVLSRSARTGADPFSAYPAERSRKVSFLKGYESLLLVFLATFFNICVYEYLLESSSFFLV